MLYYLVGECKYFKMICPKCKKEIDDNSVKCSECGAKVGRICPNCKSYNVINAMKCSNCNFVLLKTCSNCGAANTSKALTCRRCGAEFNVKKKTVSAQAISPANVETLVESLPKYEAVYSSQQVAQEKMKEAVLDDNVKIVAISGESGIGKNLVIKFVAKELEKTGLIWVSGKCSNYTKLTPFGYFQDLFLTLFNLNNFCIDLNALKNESQKFFKQEFSDLSNEEIAEFINFLYPEKYGEFKNIHTNKERLFGILKKIFYTIALNMKGVIVVNNFDYIDNMSREFINELLSVPEVFKNITFVLSFEEPKSARVCITHPILNDESYVDITIAPYSVDQLAPMFNKYKNNDLNVEQRNMITNYADGNPAVFEQYINLVADRKRFGLPFLVPKSFEGVVSDRLGCLKSENHLAYKTLVALVLLGYKSNPVILNTFNNFDLEQLDSLLEALVKLNYIVQVNASTYEFKSFKLWKVLLEKVKLDESIYKDVAEQLFGLLQNYNLSSLSVLNRISEDMGYTQQYLTVWTTIVQLASYVGDIDLFILAQKQILEIVENNKINNSETIKKNIYVQSGKLLEKINPKEGLEFLTNAIKTGLLGKYEEIELLGYIASCAMKTDNYYGVLECVEDVLNKLDNPRSIEYALVKSRKLKALNKIGNLGEVVNLAENEIIPVIENALSKNSSSFKMVSELEVFESWIYTLYELVKALTRQGNCRVFRVVSELFKILEANNIQDKEFACNLQLELALANTIRGEIFMSNKILNDIFEIYENSEVINSFVVSRLNLISILNKFFTDRDKIDVDELFKIATFADNIDDRFTKNIAKLLLGKVVLDTVSVQNAINIYTKQLEYFANEKNSIGVLLGWYLTAEATVLVNKQQALDIAQKALGIAQKPEICNHYFALLFNKLICKIYSSNKDFDSARIYLDRALTIAKGYELKYQLAKLYMMSGNCIKETIVGAEDAQEKLMEMKSLFNKVEAINSELDIMSLAKEIIQKNNELDMLSKAYGINL